MMLGSLGTKLALKKLGLPSDPLKNFDPFGSSESDREPNKLKKNPPGEGEEGDGWTSWMSVKSLPLSVQPWLNPPPPPNKVGRVPRIGDEAPRDPSGKLRLQRGRRTMVVFLRCVGCAFAQKTFLNLRTLANRYNGALHCIAVSHSSPEATRKWIDLLGGAWSVEIVIDEDRSLYAAWGLGLGNTWYVLNPATQIQAFKEKGWLGDKVAGSIKERDDRRAQNQQSQRPGMQRTGTGLSRTGTGLSRSGTGNLSRTGTGMGEQMEPAAEDGVSTTMGNKWQEAGSFAVDGRGTVIWGGKALKADDVMDLDEGSKLLMM